jgi:hypothetical protein
LDGLKPSELQDFYLNACIEAARKWSAAGWVRERRRETGAEQAFLEQFEAPRPPRKQENPRGDGQGLSPAQQKLLHEAIAKLPDHERVIWVAFDVDPVVHESQGSRSSDP